MKSINYIILLSFFLTQTIIAMQLSSPAFSNNSKIPTKYTCSGEDIPPPLSWSGIPEGTKSLVLIMDDPDAPSGNWDHWILYNIPPTTTGLAENTHNYPTGTDFGMNSWQKAEYGGPCPPKGDDPHRYFFTLYALDTKLPGHIAPSKTTITMAIEDHIIDQAELVGLYERPL